MLLYLLLGFDLLLGLDRMYKFSENILTGSKV
nr:hypothetical protein Q903MT_gene3625 [Picea sitchensis]